MTDTIRKTTKTKADMPELFSYLPFRIPADHLREETRLTPLGCLAPPEDIFDAVAFLSSDNARWIIGCTIVVDGGRV